MNKLSDKNWQQFEREHVWHPYAKLEGADPVYAVKCASGVRLTLEDGRTLIDGMASWWSVIHGYNHPVLNQAASDQLAQMAHVMFGGLTHRPAAELAARLIDITPQGLDRVFLCDSGSVSVEVAIKMALQYWQAAGKGDKQKLATIRRGYHGDTSGAMAVCDPGTGMHHLFTSILPKHFFAEAPTCRNDTEWNDQDIASLERLLNEHHHQIAALILEPVVQGAGGMRVYAPLYLRRARELCNRYQVLLIADEIATGFGRTGTLFACEQAGISPDILCIGKALTGGYMTMAAVLTSGHVSRMLSDNPPGALMHGPTFMANPLACTIACASIDLLLESPWQERISVMERLFVEQLSPCRDWPGVNDVRIKGGIAVLELEQPVNMPAITRRFVDKGVWVRPFGRLVYLMPPYVIDKADLEYLVCAMKETVAEELGQTHRS